METERLIIDPIRAADKEDYFINISHDKKVLETFICRYADTLEDFDFSSYPGRQDLFAARLKETGTSYFAYCRKCGCDSRREWRRTDTQRD